MQMCNGEGLRMVRVEDTLQYAEGIYKCLQHLALWQMLHGIVPLCQVPLKGCLLDVHTGLQRLCSPAPPEYGVKGLQQQNC